MYWISLFFILFFSHYSYSASVTDVQNQLITLNRQLQQLNDALKLVPAVAPVAQNVQKLKQQLDKIIVDNYRNNQGITKKLLDDYESLLNQYRKVETDQSKVKDYNAWKYRGLLTRYGFVPRAEVLRRYRQDFDRPMAQVSELLDTYQFWLTTYIRNAAPIPESADFVLKAQQWYQNLAQANEAIRGMDVIMAGFDPVEHTYVGYPDAPGKPFTQELFDRYQQYLKIVESALGSNDPMVGEYKNNIALLAEKIGSLPEGAFDPTQQGPTLTKQEFAKLRHELVKEKNDFDQNWQNWTRQHWLEVINKMELLSKNLPGEVGNKAWPKGLEQFYIDLNTMPIPPQ